MQDLSSEDPALQLPLDSVDFLNIGTQFTSFTGTKVQILTLQCSRRPAFGQGGKTSGQRL
jgi:hypothetical protein